jgi:hypothetical protein
MAVESAAEEAADGAAAAAQKRKAVTCPGGKWKHPCSGHCAGGRSCLNPACMAATREQAGEKWYHPQGEERRASVRAWAEISDETEIESWCMCMHCYRAWNAFAKRQHSAARSNWSVHMVVHECVAVGPVTALEEPPNTL